MADAKPWFRLYREFATDPKVQTMPEIMQRRFVMILCLQCGGDLQSLDVDEIAYALRITAEEVEDTRKYLAVKGFIDDSWNISAWDRRQYQQDDSKERVKRYRERRKSLGLSSQLSEKTRKYIITRDSGKCVYCGSNKKIAVDHMLPIVAGGTDDILNLCVACKQCNSKKSGKTPEQAKFTFMNRSVRSKYIEYLKNEGLRYGAHEND